MEQQASIRNHAPALTALAPLISGLLLARAFDAPITLLLMASTLFGVLALATSSSWPKVWTASYAIAMGLVGWAYGEIRFPTTPKAADLQLPPRITTAIIAVERPMVSSESYTSGFGKIIETDHLSRVQHRSRVYYQINRLDDSGPPQVLRGQKIRIKGVLRPIPPGLAKDPFETYLLDSGIHYRLVQTTAFEALTPPSPFLVWCNEQKIRIEKILTSGAPESSELENIYLAMLLGEKSGLNQAQKDNFTRTGTMHLFAISGLHIGVIAAVISQILLVLRTPRKLRPLIGISLLYLYVEITGAPPSAVRAFLMVAIFWLTFGLSRQRSPFAALITSALLVILIDPWQVMQIGFQLSYLVVASILLFGLPFYRITWPKIQPFRDLPQNSLGFIRSRALAAMDKIWMLLSVSLAAWLASAPLGASFFGYLAPYAILANLLLVNLAALTITTGVLSITIGTLGIPDLSNFLNNAAWVSISLMEATVDLNTKLPGATLGLDSYSRPLAYATVIAFLLTAFIVGQSRKLPSELIPFTALITIVGLAIAAV